MNTKILKAGSIITRTSQSGPEQKQFTRRMVVGVVSTGATTSVIIYEGNNDWVAQNSDFIE